MPGSVALALFGVYGEHRHRDGVAELERDRFDGRPRHERVAAIHVLRAALLGAAGVEQRGRLAGVHRLLDLGPGHHLELDERLFTAVLGERHRRGEGEGKGSDEQAAHLSFS